MLLGERIQRQRLRALHVRRIAGEEDDRRFRAAAQAICDAASIDVEVVELRDLACLHLGSGTSRVLRCGTALQQVPREIKTSSLRVETSVSLPSSRTLEMTPPSGM